MVNVKHNKNQEILLILLLYFIFIPLTMLAQVPPQTAMIFFKFHSQYNPTHWGIPNWGEPGNPGNFPLRNNWCTVACLDMIFSFYDGLGGPPPHPAGPPLPQQQIKAVANTDGATGGPWGGTYEDDARRATHFSVLSTGLNGGANGYSWRGLGYSAIDDNWKTQGWTLNQLKKLIATGYPLIVHVFPDSMMKYHESCPFMPAPGSESPTQPDSDYTNHGDTIQSTVLGHSVVLIGYNDSPVVWNNINPGWIAYYCPTLGARQSPQNFFWNTFWGGDFLFAAPWKLFTTCPQNVCTNSKFVVGMNAWYSAPWKIAVPNQNNVYPVDTSIATISVPAGFSLPNNDPVKDIYQWIKDAGDYTPPQIIILWIPGIPPSAGHFIIIVLPRILWTVKAPGAAGAANIKVDAKGVLHKCTSTSYPGPAGYKDTIGGRTTLAVNVVPLIAANPGFDLHGPTYWQSSTGNGIWYSPSPPEAGQTTNIFAEVHNYGTSPTSGGTVNFYRGNPTLTQSAGSTNWTSLGSRPLPTINPGDSATVGPLPVTFPPANSYGESYFTIFAKINYTDDPGTTGWFLEDDNVTCENYRTAQGTIGVPETLTFLVENPESRSYYFAVGIDKSQLPSGWTAQLSAPLDSDPPLIPSGGTLPVKLIVTPSSAGAGKVDMMGYLIDTTGTIVRITGGLTFQVNAVATRDVGVDEIIYPRTTELINTAMIPVARVKNYGTTTASFSVSCSIFGQGQVLRYASSQTVLSLYAGDTLRVNFSTWIPTLREECIVKMRTNLSGDQVSSNDGKTRTTDIVLPVTILSPNGGESLVGSNYDTIRWRSAVSFSRSRLLLSKNSGSTYSDTIAHNISPSESTYNWLVPNLTLNTCRIKVQLLDSLNTILAEDASDNDFTIRDTTSHFDIDIADNRFGVVGDRMIINLIPGTTVTDSFYIVNPNCYTNNIDPDKFGNRDLHNIVCRVSDLTHLFNPLAYIPSSAITLYNVSETLLAGQGKNIPVSVQVPSWQIAGPYTAWISIIDTISMVGDSFQLLTTIIDIGDFDNTEDCISDTISATDSLIVIGAFSIINPDTSYNPDPDGPSNTDLYNLRFSVDTLRNMSNPSQFIPSDNIFISCLGQYGLTPFKGASIGQLVLGDSASIWVWTHIPSGQSQGTYQGWIKIYDDNSSSRDSTEIRLTVVGYEDVISNKHIYKNWQIMAKNYNEKQIPSRITSKNMMEHQTHSFVTQERMSRKRIINDEHIARDNYDLDIPDNLGNLINNRMTLYALPGEQGKGHFWVVNPNNDTNNYDPDPYGNGDLDNIRSDFRSVDGLDSETETCESLVSGNGALGWLSVNVSSSMVAGQYLTWVIIFDTTGVSDSFQVEVIVEPQEDIDIVETTISNSVGTADTLAYFGSFTVVNPDTSWNPDPDGPSNTSLDSLRFSAEILLDTAFSSVGRWPLGHYITPDNIYLTIPGLFDTVPILDAVIPEISLGDSASVEVWMRVPYNTRSAIYKGAIQVQDNDGWPSDVVGLYVTVTSDSIPPAIPLLISPIGGSWQTDSSVIFHWSQVTFDAKSPVRYILQVDTLTTFITPRIDTTSLVFDTLILPQDRYYWRAKAYDLAGNQGAFSSCDSFGIDNTAPSIPNLVSPANNAMINNANITFVWNRSTDNVSGIWRYTLEYARNSGFTSPIDTIVSDTSITITLTDTTFYWRVKAQDRANNQSSWSSTRSFELDTRIPNAPVLVSPINGVWLVNTNVIFNWSQVTLNDSKIERFKDSKISESANLQTDVLLSPVRYILQVDTSRNFTNPIIDTTGRLFDTLVLSQARYYWRVRAYDLAGNQGAFSGRDSFGIDNTTPSVPNLVSPANGAMINNANVTFVWNRATDNLSGVVRYTLQGAIDPGFIISLDTIVTDTTITITLIDTTYYWRVKSHDRAGNQSSWSSTRSFELDTRIPNTPVLASPLNGIWLTNTSVVFNWSQVTLNDSKIGKLKDAKILESANLESSNLQTDVLLSPIRYILQVDTSRNFTNPIIDTTGLLFDTLVLNQARYFWRVKAYDLAGNQGTFSGRDSFGVDNTAPSVPNLVSPINGAVLTDSFVRFIWRRSTDNVSGVREYRLQVAVDSNFISPIDTITQDSTITLLLRNTRYWRVKAIDRANNQSNWSERRMLTVTGIEETNNPTITCFFIQNSPNPFLRFTDIRYGVPLNTNVKITIYNSTGTEIATLINRIHNPGLYSIRWNTKDNKGKICPNSIYFYRLVTDEYQATRKMLMLK